MVFVNTPKSNFNIFTVTLATPAVFSKTAHGLVAGNQITLFTTGLLPTGLAMNTNYFVISAGLTSGAFELSATSGGSAINTSGSQSGTQYYQPAWVNKTKN